MGQLLILCSLLQDSEIEPTAVGVPVKGLSCPALNREILAIFRKPGAHGMLFERSVRSVGKGVS